MFQHLKGQIRELKKVLLSFCRGTNKYKSIYAALGVLVLLTILTEYKISLDARREKFLLRPRKYMISVTGELIESLPLCNNHHFFSSDFEPSNHSNTDKSDLTVRELLNEQKKTVNDELEKNRSVRDAVWPQSTYSKNKNSENMVKSSRVFEDSSNSLPICQECPSGLQGQRRVEILSNVPTLKEIEQKNPLVSQGGHYQPTKCKAKWKVAIIIPFRNREEHLHHFLHFMHPILQRQQLDYRIYIINQFGNGKFNRAKLLNVGYAEAIKDYDFQCFVFHDVDLILENDYVMYKCPEMPLHLASAMSKFDYSMPYDTFFGGACELTKEQFQKANGFSNQFWGWGGEDDDMYNRIMSAEMNVIRYPTEMSRYVMFSHKRDKGNEANPQRNLQILHSGFTMSEDGLNNLDYEVVSRQDNSLFTNVTVNIFAPSEKENQQYQEKLIPKVTFLTLLKQLFML